MYIYIYIHIHVCITFWLGHFPQGIHVMNASWCLMKTNSKFHISESVYSNHSPHDNYINSFAHKLCSPTDQMR